MSDTYGHDFLHRPLTRRQALKTLGAVGAASLVGAPRARRAGAEPSPAKRPNVVFILSDDHRWDYLSCMGHPFIHTPNMDRLAAEGVLFENSFITTSLCSPSRACFLTGQYASRHGVRNNLTVWRDENVTVLELLKARGYDTAFIGKWHMPGRMPNLRGVDQFITFTVQGGQGRYFDCPLIVDGVETPARHPYITTDLTNYAIEFIDRPRDAPFCVYLAHKAVHHQFLPPSDLKDLYADQEIAWPAEADEWVGSTHGNIYAGTLGPLTPKVRNYCAAIVALDREIGRIITHLEERGMLDDTVFVYTTDNGYFWGEHRLVDKRWPYEESIRVPLIVRYPGLIRDPGRRAPQMTLNIDAAPTLLELAGAPVPDTMQGQSYAPILAAPHVEGRAAWLYEYFQEFPYNVPEHFAVRTPTHLYAEYKGRRPPELFDVVADPRELHNLMGTPQGDTLQPDLQRQLHELMAANGL